MDITIKRTTTNLLFTTGEIFINGKRQAFTVEPTQTMLPNGIYTVRYAQKAKLERRLQIVGKNKQADGTKTEKQHKGWAIGAVNSWIDARKTKTIGIGEPLIPGVVTQSAKVTKRITNRLEKCKQRGETATLVITGLKELKCVPRFWNRFTSIITTAALTATLALTLTACSSQRHLQQDIGRSSRDSVSMTTLSYDSIFIYESHTTDYRHAADTSMTNDGTRVDTVFVNDKSIEYRYRIKKDTVVKTAIDTIPVVHDVVTVKEVARTPLLTQMLAIVGIFALAIGAVKYIK